MPTNPAAVLAIAVDANTLQANAALAKTQTQLRATATTANASTAAMRRALLGVGVVAVGTGVALFKIGEEFDKASDTIRTKTGATGKELAKLEGSFRNVVSSVPVDFDDAAEAVGGLNQRLGLSGRPLNRMAKQLTALSKITGTDVEENVKAVSRAFVDWEVKTRDQSRTLDAFFRLSQASGLAVSDIAESVQRFGSPLRQLGIDLDTAAALFANFERAGVNTQTMVPGLKLALGSLNQPIGEAEKQLKKFNITIGNAPKGLREVFKVLGDDNVKAVDRISLAMAVFGRRAGADMKEAIEQGRFEVQNFLDVMRDGKETIRGTERQTRDFSESMTLLKNRVMVLLEPVAAKVFEALGSGAKELSRALRGRGGLAGGIKSVVNALKDFWDDSAIFRAAMRLMLDITKRVWAGIRDIFSGQIKIIRGIVRVISGVLTGNFGRAWDGVRDIFRGSVQAVLGIFRAMSAPFRAIGVKVGGALVGAFKDMSKKVGHVWVKMTSALAGVGRGIINVIRSVADVVRKVVHFIVGAVNRAVSALGNLKDKIPSISLPSLPSVDLPGPGVGVGPFDFNRGGDVPGVGNTDTVPAMLTPGEFVVRKEQVAKHRKLLEQINFQGYAKGGIVPVPGSPGESANSAIMPALTSWLKRFDAVLFDAFGSGHASLEHTKYGTAADVGPASGNWGGLFGQGLKYAVQHGYTPVYYDGSYGTTPLANHGPGNHAHITFLTAAEYLSGKSAGGVTAGMIPNIAKHIKGTGPMAGVARGAAEKMRKSANAYISQISPVPDVPGVGAAGAGGVMSPGQIASLWSSVNGRLGSPGLMARIAMAESSGNPKAVGHDPGGTTGYGLWQITSGFHDDLIRRFSPILDPANNAKAAASILRSEGTGAWAASAPWQKGGMVMPPFAGSFGDGGTVPGPVGSPRTIVAHGGEHVGDSRPVVYINFSGDIELLRDFINVEIDERDGLHRQLGRMG